MCTTFVVMFNFARKITKMFSCEFPLLAVLTLSCVEVQIGPIVNVSLNVFGATSLSWFNTTKVCFDGVATNNLFGCNKTSLTFRLTSGVFKFYAVTQNKTFSGTFKVKDLLETQYNSLHASPPLFFVYTFLS